MAKFEVPEYTEEDFKGLLYPVFEIPEGKSIMDTLGDSELDFKEFKAPIGKYGFKPGEKDKVIQWIACVFDMASPFISDFQDVNTRKVIAAAYVGFEVDDSKRFEDHIEKMMMGSIEPVVDMIIRYCRGYNQPDYSFLVAIWQDYYRTLKIIQQGKDYDYKKVSDMRNDIKTLSKAFLLQDDSSKIIEKLYKDIEEDSLLLTPEDIAQKITDGVSPILNEEISEYQSEHIIGVSTPGDEPDSESGPKPVSD